MGRRRSEMERQFFVYEIPEELPIKLVSITETELCRRFDLALKRRMEESTPTRELLPILVTGEEE